MESSPNLDKKKVSRREGKLKPVRDAIANEDIDQLLWKMIDEMWIRHSKDPKCKNTAIILGKCLDHICARKPSKQQANLETVAEFLNTNVKILTKAAPPPAIEITHDIAI